MSLRCDLVRAPGAPPAHGPSHVLFLHGLGDSRDGWKPVLGELRLPGVSGLFAEAPLPYPPDDPFGWSWFDLHPSLHIDLNQVRAHHALLVELLEALERDHGIACERMAVIGFSQGAVMALELALRHPRVFAGVVAISGWVAAVEDYPQACAAAASRQRILVTHGVHDPVVPYALSQPRTQRLIDCGLPIMFRNYVKAHHLDAQELRDIGDFLMA